MGHGKAEAAAAAAGLSSDSGAWEGRELEVSANIWASDLQDNTTLDQSNPQHAQPRQSPSITTSRPRSDSLDSLDSFDSFDDVSFADIDNAAPTESDDDFELVDEHQHELPKTSRYRDRLAALYSRYKGARNDGADDFLSDDEEEGGVGIVTQGRYVGLRASRMDAGSSSNDYGDAEWQQAGPNADAQDLAGPGAHGFLLCRVEKPQTESEGTQNAYVSYLVITDTDFKSFQNSHSSVRRRYQDFNFLYRTLQKEYPQCAVPPLPDKQNMSYVRGDRFSQDFTARRAHSLDRFLKRLTLHPVLRRAVILTLFLESSDWNATMRSRPQRGMSGSERESTGLVESWTDTFLNAFAKPHKTDKRFADVNNRATKLDEDLGTVSKTVARVAKREADLEVDYGELAVQFQKLAALEPGVAEELNKFAASVSETSEGWRELKEHTDQNYLGSLKDMEAYILSVKALLKTREQKQLDFEGLTEYLNKAAYERDTLASHGGTTGTTGYLRRKLEDVQGIDQEHSRRERQRKLEVQISRLQTEVESSKKMSEAFDEEVVKEVQDFERIKAVEFRECLGGLADAHIEFFKGNIEIWEKFVREMEELQRDGGGEGEVGR